MAIVVAPYHGDGIVAKVGDKVEVVGWVHAHGQLQAVIRDDEGVVECIPAGAIRLQPAVKA